MSEPKTTKRYRVDGWARVYVPVHFDIDLTDDDLTAFENERAGHLMDAFFDEAHVAKEKAPIDDYDLTPREIQK
jgi:hypothetical protein